jgi:putative ABC transport system permease protein
MYVPVAQTHTAALRMSHSYFPINWVVRASDPGPDLIRRVQEEIRSLDPKQPFSAFRTMDTVKAMSMAVERFQMTLLTVLACIGLLMATAGVYGLIAYSVAQRTREFGIRIALGATSSRILAAVVRQGATLAVIGVAAGIGASVVFTRTLQAFLFGVDTLDPWTIGGVGVLLVIVAVAACCVPALRAVRLNPVTALRE